MQNNQIKVPCIPRIISLLILAFTLPLCALLGLTIVWTISIGLMPCSQNASDCSESFPRKHYLQKNALGIS